MHEIKTKKTQKGSFSKRLDSYLVEKRLPRSMSWAGALVVLWKHYYLNYIVQFIGIILVFGVGLPYGLKIFGVTMSISGVRIGPIGPPFGYLIYI